MPSAFCCTWPVRRGIHWSPAEKSLGKWGLERAICRAKLVESEPGFQGGFYLSRPAEEITLYDIMMAAEDTMALNRCLLDKGLCDRGAAPYCKVHQCFIVFQGEMEARLQDIHLSDLV